VTYEVLTEESVDGGASFAAKRARKLRRHQTGPLRIGSAPAPAPVPDEDGDDSAFKPPARAVGDNRDTIGTQLAAHAKARGWTVSDLANKQQTYNEGAEMIWLSSAQIQRVFDSAGTVSAVKAVAAVMRLRLAVHGLQWKPKSAPRLLDLCSAAGLSMKTARKCLRAVTSFGDCDGALLIASVEHLLFAANGFAQIRLEK
jgi:hypothetical protein